MANGWATMVVGDYPIEKGQSILVFDFVWEGKHGFNFKRQSSSGCGEMNEKGIL